MVTEIFIDGKAIEENTLTSVVTLRENAVADCLLTANNEQGIAYLNALKLQTEVRVKYYWADKVGDTPYECFRGKIVEINPSTTMSGEVMSVRAYGNAICLKDMRVVNEYGYESATGKGNALVINDDEEVDGWALHINQWTHVNNSPWLHVGDSDKITIPADATYAGYADGDFSFQNFSCARDTMSITKLELRLRCRLTTGAGGAADQAEVRASIHDGHVWHNFDVITINSTSWTIYTIDALGELDIANFDDFKLYLTLVDVSGGGATMGNVEISWAYFHIEGSGYNDKSTLRDILTDADIGIIPKYVEKILGGATNSGYSLDDDYVYDESSAFRYVYMPYESAFDCLRDLINLLSAMKYPNAGAHWIVLPTGELCVAPVGNHFVTGAAGHTVEDVWKTYARITPIAVAKHNIIEDFKQEEPEANYVIVAGNFEFPTGDIWCEDTSLWTSTDVKPQYSSDSVRGDYSIKMTRSSTYAAQNWWLVDDMAIDLDTIATEHNPVTLKIWLKKNALEGIASTLVIRLYTGAVLPFDINNSYFYKQIWADVPTDGVWYPIELELGENGGWTAHNGTGLADWNSINHIGFTTTFGGLILNPYLLVDGIILTGSVIRVAYNSTNIGTYDCKMKVIKDCLATNIGFDSADDSSMLAQVAKMELLRSQRVSTTGKISIELDPHIMAGQLIHVHGIRSSTLFTHTYTYPNKPHPNNYQSHYKIDQDFRIVEVVHNFSTRGATTTLSLTDDLTNSISIGPADSYSTIIRVNTPDFQTKTMASLKATKEFDIDLIVLAKDYPS